MAAWWLTWLWQGLALTLATSAAFRVLPHVNAATRYWIWWCTLGAMGAMGAMGASGASGAMHLLVVPAAPDALVTIAFGVWAVVALLGFLRVLVGVGAVCALRDRCRPFPAGLEAQLPLWLESQGRGRRVRLMLCDTVAGATMLGFGRARIALASSLVEALTPGELDQILLHEYAHVQRRDDWTRLAQALLQSALWIHPAIALVGRRLNLEREVACDEWVVARTALPKAYAQCLTRAAEMACLTTRPMLGSALFGNTRQLVRRIERLLAVKGRVRPKVSAIAALAGACALVAISLQFRSLPLVAEVGEVVLPAFANAPAVRINAAPTGNASVHVKVRLKPDTPNAPAAPVAPVAPNAPAAPVLTARTFDGQYRPVSAAFSPTEAPRPWRVAERAGTRIAQTVTRAGVSLARRF